MKEHIKKLLTQKENYHLEFKKASFAIPDDVYETVCAFLNSDGGEILLGVNDDGNIEGIIENEVENMKNNFITTINNGTKISPSIVCNIKDIKINDKIILYIPIERSSQVHRCNNKIFIRQESLDLNKTNDNETITRLYLNKSIAFSENTIYPGIKYEDLREDLIEKAKQIAIKRNPSHIWKDLDYKSILKKSSLYIKDYTTQKEGYTLAAVLLFGSEDLIQSILPSYRIDLIKRTTGNSRYDDRIDLRKNLIESYDEILDFINKYLPNPFFLEGSSRINLRDIIFREIVANMLVHKEYLGKEPTRLIIEKDRIITENSNRPHFKRIINVEKLTPYPKNPNISKIFRQLGRVEELGSGVENLLKYSKAYFGYMPSIEDGDIFKFNVEHNFFSIVKINKNKKTTKQKIKKLDLFSETNTPQAETNTPQAKTNTPQAETNTPQAETNTPQAETFEKQIEKFCNTPKSLVEIMTRFNYKDRKSFKNKINKLLKNNILKQTIPDKPTSPNQKYIAINLPPTT